MKPTLLRAACTLSASLLLACVPVDGGPPPVSIGDAGADGGAAQPHDEHTHGDHAEHVDGPSDGRGEDPLIGERVDAIHGAVTFDGCTIEQQHNLLDALEYARERVGTAVYRECLSDAFGVEDEGRMVETLWADTNSPRRIEFRCQPGDAWAQAFADDHIEWMNIFGDIAETTSTPAMAATIVHEISHNHDWGHFHFYGPTWPDQALSCLFREHPFGMRRSQVAGPRTLNHAGGDGGTRRGLRCTSEEAMVGIAGALADDGRLVRLQPICQRVEGGDRVGVATNFALDVPAGAAAFHDFCPAGYGVIGLEGSAHRFVERVRAVCAELDDLRAESGAVSTHNRSYRGWLSGDAFSRRCPARAVATGMVVRTGALVDGFELECDDFPLQNRHAGRWYGSHGGQGGQPEYRGCPGNTALVGVWGQWSQVGGALANAGGRCLPIHDQGMQLDNGWGRSVAFTEHAGRLMRTESADIRRYSSCDDGEVLVGLDVAADRFVGDIAAVCADAEDWLAGGQATRRMPSGTAEAGEALRVRAGESVRAIRCPSTEVGVAMSFRVGSLVDQIGLICRPPESVGTLRRLEALGGPDGRGFEEICAEGRAVVGLNTEVGGGLLRGVAARCGRTTDSGTSVVSPTLASTVRGTDAADNTDDCGPGQVMIGLGLGISNTSVEWLSGICADEDGVRIGEQQNVRYGRWRGRTRNLHTVTELRCPAGEVVRGLHGRRQWRGGDGYDETFALAPVCGKVTLMDGAEVTGSVSGLRGEVFPLRVPADFAGRLQFRVSTARHVQPRIRLRRGYAPTDAVHDFELEGGNGWATLAVDDIEPGHWFVEVGLHYGVGSSYRLQVDAL